MKIPDQVLHVGDLVRVTKNWWPNFQGGEIGLVTLARCDKVCVKGGLTHLSPGEGGPEHAMEWCYVGRFAGGPVQGVRLDRLSPVEVISESL